MEPTAESTPFRSSLGRFVLHAYSINGREHAALVAGDLGAMRQPLVRVQSSCLTGTAFLAELCDCRQQLHAAMSLVADSGGIVIYLAQEGRDHGLVEKVGQLAFIAEGLDTVDAAERRGRPADRREYSAAAQILGDLIGADVPVRALTNNPEKIEGLRRAGVNVSERVPLETEPTDGNREYLRVKKARMGHLLGRV
jgi:3,4-dihydroxy 2-butanone 4-phosphate synthase/GTP cyclohydrolase II